MFWKKRESSFHAFKVTSSSFLLVLLFAAVFIFIILIGPRPYKGVMQVGDIARRTIKAPFDFYVQGDIDSEATSENVDKAIQSVVDIYVFDKSKNDSIYAKTLNLFKEVDNLRADKDINEKDKVSLLKEKSPLDFKTAYYSYLLSLNQQQSDEFETSIIQIFNSITKNPIFDPVEKVKIADKTKTITLILPDGKEQILETNSLMTTKDALSLGKSILAEYVQDKTAQSLTDELIGQSLVENVSFDEKLTNKRKEEAAKVEPVVYHERLIKENSIIVAKSQLITRDHLNYLNQLSQLENDNETRGAKIYYYYSISIFVLLLTVLLWMYIKLYEPHILSSVNNVALIGLISFIVILSAKLITFSPLSRYFVPLASASILIAILLSSRLAIVMTVFLSIFISLISGGQLNIFIYYLAGGLIGIYSVKNVRRRAQLLKAGLFIGLTSCLTIINVDLLDNLSTDVMFMDSLWAISNGFVCAFIVTGILPVLEYIFKITTNISLLELSDLNHPLLKEMVIRAPGTYHHSLIVGNLAENAADAIGANSLLARVGAYYHDVGKLLKPEYFSENQMGFADKHAELTPKMSSLIITNHIKDGLDLARKFKLSGAIQDFIQQHHGNSLTFYFYQRAIENESNEGEAKEEDFRYKSPLPQTKEVAIVLLADSVEAATRALSNQTPKKIKQTVQKIINNKFIDGQLDECDLTLKDLHKISESFSKLLAGIYHSRVEYPDPEKDEEEPKKEKGKNGLKNKSNK
jgi:hypothetical protein